MRDGVLESDRVGPAGDAELIAEAKAILEANWLGHATSPSKLLYPHQWSWDAACIAMGYAAWNQERAETELRSLFAGQWSDGLLPHIVFTDGARYFPGPEFWQTERSPDAPAWPRTSGIVQPPIHATAALQVYRVASDRRRAAVFLEELHAEADGVARVPVPRARTNRRRPRRDLAPVGVRDGQLAALGRRARTSGVRRRAVAAPTSEWTFR